MFPKLTIILLFLQFSSVYALFSENDEKLKTLLAKIKSASESLSFRNTVKLKINNQLDNYEQRVIVRDCSISVSIFFDKFRLFYSDYEITTKRAISNGQFFGSLGIFFSLESILFADVPVLFNTKEDREIYAKKLRELRSLCISKTVAEFFSKSGIKEKSQRKIIFDGKIPLTADANGRVNRYAGPVFRNNMAAPLQGEESLFERIKAIGEAKRSIRLQALDYRGDPVGILISEALIKKREEGLNVQVNVDGIANLFPGYFETDSANGQILYNNMMAAGIRVFGFSCGSHKVINEAKRFDIHKFLRRNHEKMLIIDEDRAFVGGPNTSFQYHRMGGYNDSSWRDLDLYVKGDVISQIVSDFERNVREKQIRYKTYKSDKDCFNPFNPIAAKKEYVAFKNAKTLPYKLDKNSKQLKEKEYISRNFNKLMSGLKLNFSSASMADDSFYIPLEPTLFRKVNAARFILNRPEYEEDYIYEAYLDLIGRARNEILIANQFFIPDEKMLKALTDAIDRGVKVRVLTNGLITNKELIYATLAGRYYYQDLYYNDLVGKVRGDFSVFEWEGIKKGDRKTLMGRFHAKYMVVDREILLIGSYNFSNSSRLNSESVIIIDGSNVAKNFVDYFYDDLNLSIQITPQEMKKYKNFKPGDSAFSFWLARKIQTHL